MWVGTVRTMSRGEDERWAGTEGGYIGEGGRVSFCERAGWASMERS